MLYFRFRIQDWQKCVLTCLKVFWEVKKPSSQMKIWAGIFIKPCNVKVRSLKDSVLQSFLIWFCILHLLLCLFSLPHLLLPVIILSHLPSFAFFLYYSSKSSLSWTGRASRSAGQKVLLHSWIKYKTFSYQPFFLSSCLLNDSRSLVTVIWMSSMHDGTSAT